MVAYSKLLVNEQREVLQQLNDVVRSAPQFGKSSSAGKLIRIPSGDGMALVFFRVPKNLCIARWKLPERSRVIHTFAFAWAFIAVLSIKSRT